MRKMVIVKVFVFTMMSLFLMIQSHARDVVQKGKQVSVEYTLMVDGKEVETTKGSQPLVYEQGKQMLIPGLEKELTSMRVGQEKRVVVPAKDAYGEIDKTLIREFGRDRFPSDVQLTEGMIIEMQDDQGNLYPATIDEVKQQTVLLDFNHPLAGKTLTFDVKIIAIENAIRK